jgi:NADH-quinone oxidoreductase subunit J
MMMVLGLFLFFLFSSFGILCSFLVISSKNPALSALFLILTFFNFSSLLFLLRLEFLSIIFIVVYVGAVAILFLFIIMLLNAKLSELYESKSEYLLLAAAFALVFLFEMAFLLRLEFSPILFSCAHLGFLSDFACVASSTSNFFLWNFFAPNARYLGLVLFTEYFYSFIISGLILLLAMTGVIVLTLHKKFVAKSQNVFAQVLRDYRVSVVCYF